jgi:putative ABC transport system permease protein
MHFMRKTILPSLTTTYSLNNSAKGWSDDESIFRQVRLAIRLWIGPRSTIIAIATLALAMGAGTAVFTAVNAILLRPLVWESGSNRSGEQHQQDATEKLRTMERP